jgi:hypothetical protein
MRQTLAPYISPDPVASDLLLLCYKHPCSQHRLLRRAHPALAGTLRHSIRAGF